MMKPTSSLLIKILCWFFLNIVLVAAVLAVFFVFQLQINLHAIFGQAGSNRLQTAAMLILNDLNQTSQANWSEALARHAAIHQVDFALVFEDGSRFSSKNMDVPDMVIKKVRDVLRPKHPPDRFPPPHLRGDPQRRPDDRAIGDARGFPKKEPFGEKPPPHIRPPDKRPHLMMKTRNPTRYWSGIRTPPLSSGSLHRPVPALLMAVSDSITGNGFFFDPLPWMIVAAAMILISALLWIPMVRHITGPLARMTRATEEVAKGRFELSVQESRADEIGRLARAINHMTSRLSAFVKGQKRFLGDVAHELGTPIARIQFGLGALEQRVGQENQKRVIEVMEDVDHMSKLVNELLAFSRAGMNAKAVKLEKVDLFPLVQAAVMREITLTAEIINKVDPDIRVIASAELLTRALANLLRNAVNYAGDTGPITVSAKKRNNNVTIEVLDTGPGVSEEFLDQLFEPFFRPEPSRDRDSGGVGLGLAIVKTCVETCHGTVSAANLKPRGFLVTITLNT